MFTALIGPIANLASSWMSSKVEKVKADGQAKVAQAKAKAVVAEKVAAGEVQWENTMADATDNSWKDEFWTLIFAIPLVMCFIPSLVPYVVEGFAALDGMPEWYRYALGTLVAASVGFRKLTDVMGKQKT